MTQPAAPRRSTVRLDAAEKERADAARECEAATDEAIRAAQESLTKSGKMRRPPAKEPKK